MRSGRTAAIAVAPGASGPGAPLRVPKPGTSTPPATALPSKKFMVPMKLATKWLSGRS
jgi:hypothetical protein